MKGPSQRQIEIIKRNAGTIGKQTLIVIAALFIATILVILCGFDWMSVFDGILNALIDDIAGTLRWFTPLLLTGLACAVAFRAGIWNMGADGQLYMGAIFATAIALRLQTLPGPVLMPIVFVTGMAAGAIWAAIAGFLRIYCGAKEVVTTILLNYIAFHFTDYMVHGPLKGSGGYALSESSDLIPESVWLTKIIPGSSVSTGILIALALVVVCYILTTKTKFGYENRMLGTNSAFANYGGIHVRKSYMMTIAISGALAGLAGVVEMLGVHHHFAMRFSSDLGFDGMVVSILANDSALGVPISAFFFAILQNGSYNIERFSDVPRTLITVVQALVILMAGSKFVFKRTLIMEKIKGALKRKGDSRMLGGQHERDL